MGAVLYMSKMPKSCAECDLLVEHYDGYEDIFEFQCGDTKNLLSFVDVPKQGRDENCRLIGIDSVNLNIDGNSICFA